MMAYIEELETIPTLRVLLVTNIMDKRFFKNVSALAGVIISTIFTIVPEEVFNFKLINYEWSETTIIIVNRLIACFCSFIFAIIVILIYRSVNRSVTISDKTFSIKVQYKNLIKIKRGKKVISFDECFSSNVGDRPEDIKPESLCGQYLRRHPIDDMKALIQATGLQPNGVSLYQNKDAYKPGTIIPRGKYFLMSFAKLDEKGLGRLSYDEYLDCLNTLWEQIDCYHGTDDVYIPILGSGITRIGKELSQQDLLDIMVASYRLSPKKMKKPFTLHIVCKRHDDFSLNHVFGVV